MMTRLLALAAVVTLAASAAAFDLGNSAPTRPAKPPDNSVYVPPKVPRQGGDTILTAVPIGLYDGAQYTGTTVGYVHNYDEACPYSGSTAPDVVYKATPATTGIWCFDLCYSSYDTKIYIYDQDLNLVACNDDFWFDPPCYTYSSRLYPVTLQAGVEYYIVIDGYGSASGAYVMDIPENCGGGCVIECPDNENVQLEGEPPLVNGYLDAFNGGCNSPEFDNPFQTLLAPVVCGTTGFYLSADQSQYRDTDWFYASIPTGGVLEIAGDAEQMTAMYQLSGDCAGIVSVVQSMTVGPCNEAAMTIAGEPGAQVMFWVGASWDQEVFSNPMEWNWILYTNLEQVIATESNTWSSVKALFK